MPPSQPSQHLPDAGDRTHHLAAAAWRPPVQQRHGRRLCCSWRWQRSTVWHRARLCLVSCCLYVHAMSSKPAHTLGQQRRRHWTAPAAPHAPRRRAGRRTPAAWQPRKPQEQHCRRLLRRRRAHHLAPPRNAAGRRQPDRARRQPQRRLVCADGDRVHAQGARCCGVN